MKSILSTLLFCLLATLASYATIEDGKGIVTGRVTTSDGQPAVVVTVTLKGTQRNTITDEQGNFILRGVPEGTHQLEISLTGYETTLRDVEVQRDKTVRLSIQLTVSQKQLEEVIISRRNSNKVNTFVAKTPLKDLENPQVYSSVSAEIVKQQGLTNFDDVLRNVPGVARTWESTGRSGDGAAYFAIRGFEAQPSLYNGLPGFTAGDLDLADVEEVQVLKGPSGTLFGANFYGYGGIINVITKKPYFNTGGEVTYTAGSFGLNRIAADINTPLSKTDKIAIRVNTAYSTENSFQDAGYKKMFFVAPALTYQVNDKLTFNFMTEILQEDRAVAPVFFQSNRADPLSFKNVSELGLDPYQSFTSNDLSIKNPRFTMQGEMRYKFNDHWSSQTAVSKGSIQSKGYYGYIFGNDPGSNQFEQDIHKENQTTNTIDIQQNFNGDIHTGGIRHRLLLGLDYFNQNVIDNGTGYSFMRLVTPQGGISYPAPDHPVYATQASVDSLLASSGNSHSNISNSTYAVYFSDVINFTPNLAILTSLRADYFVSKGEHSDPSDDFHQFELSPKFGIVYQPVLDKVSIFANYMNAFLNVSPMQVTDPDGSNPRVKSFRPEHASQFEAGVKTVLLADKLTLTASYYDIRLSNRVLPIVGNINDFDQRGKVGSKGLEVEADANPIPGLSLIAGYSHNHTQVLSGDGTDFYNEKGRSPGGQGPGEQANLWVTYKIRQGDLKNFGLGIGGNYAGIYKVIDNSVVGEFDLPSYVLLNASLFYNNDKVRITLNGNNLTNKQYYIGYWSINPQRRINFTASMAFRF